MTQKTRKELKPKLRFPEFRDAGPWIADPLRNGGCLINEKAGEKKCTLLSVTSGKGMISQLEKFGQTIAGKSYKNYYLLNKNDFAYNKSSTKLYPQGYIARYTGDEPGSVPNSIFSCFRVDETKIDPEYLDHLFHSNHHGKWLRKYITVGARAHGALSISDDDLLSLPIPLPGGKRSKNEQARIAECLSSLDELFAAHERKLELLKDYKNGLMQSLYPRPGETQPRLRFPEFRDDPEWGEETISSIAENLDKRRVPITRSNRESGSIPYYGASGIVDYVNDFLFDEDLLCVSEDGANLVDRVYPIAFSISGKTWVNNHAHVLRFKSRSTQTIVEEYLNSLDLVDFLTGMAQPKLNKEMLNKIPIPLPCHLEQDRLSGCLSSLNKLMASQAQLIELLSSHKKGLMQQLFPSPVTLERAD